MYYDSVNNSVIKNVSSYLSNSTLTEASFVTPYTIGNGSDDKKVAFVLGNDYSENKSTLLQELIYLFNKFESDSSTFYSNFLKLKNEYIELLKDYKNLKKKFEFMKDSSLFD